MAGAASRRLLGALRTGLWHVGAFAWRVLRGFSADRGVLLAGAVGYNALLSLVPLLAITLVVLSHFFDVGLISRALLARVQPLAPGLAPAIRDAIGSFIEHRSALGWGGLAMLYAVSSVAFRMLEDAFALIFRRPSRLRPRPLRTSLLIQLGYVPLVSTGIALLSVLTVGLGALAHGEVLDRPWIRPIAGALYASLGTVGFVVLVVLLSSFYWVMPVVRIPLKLALVGGSVAASLWLLAGAALGWFFANLSLVPVLYGSLGTVIVLLVSMEVFAGILLLGAELVAQIDRSWRAKLRWWQPAPEPPPLSVTAS